MSEVLARIRVREMHGIRRFLYPLRATLLLPDETFDTDFGMVDGEGQAVPFQISPIYLGNDLWSQDYTCDFAVSLEPFADQEYVLAAGKEKAPVGDPLQVTSSAKNAINSTQQKFSIALDWDGSISAVTYDGLSHLRQPSEISRNGVVVKAEGSSTGDTAEQLAQDVVSAGIYPADKCGCRSQVNITACKSWATVTHTLEQPKPGDEIVFTLPLAVTSPTLTCDFGVGGYVFGKLDAKATEVVWQTEFGDMPYARWSVATAGRVDYLGCADTAEAFLPQRWFHLIDSDKALAVAITKLPEDCREMTVRLTNAGDVTVTFCLGTTITGPAEFGVCYHFLNDVPAIAAATNPQSVLLPPLLEVLTP